MGDIINLKYVSRLTQQCVQAALNASIAGVTVFRRDGSILYINASYLRLYGHAEGTTMPQIVGPIMWTLWDLEAQFVLRTRNALRYITEVGRTADGLVVSDRCPEWDNKDVRPERTVYVETIPVSVSRQIVGCITLPLTDVLRHMPIADLEATLAGVVQTKESPH
nr:MAG: hypothetical protein DIU57_04395 [Pseudomonadota bacterium]